MQTPTPAPVAGSHIRVSVVVVDDAGHIETRLLRLPAYHATVSHALRAAGIDPGRHARAGGQAGLQGVGLFGLLTWEAAPLSDGARIDVVTPVSLDAKTLRRDRVQQRKQADAKRPR